MFQEFLLWIHTQISKCLNSLKYHNEHVLPERKREKQNTAIVIPHVFIYFIYVKKFIQVEVYGIAADTEFIISVKKKLVNI